jgi:SAM-dependent methyltransferase
LLEVGCGVGFCVDYWSRIMNSEALGLEKAAYGKEGARRLGANIRPAYLGEGDALDGHRFDIVFSSEVIEHVADPADFLRHLAGAVTETGIVVLTTPAAEYIQPGNRQSTILAQLAPGFHYFLLSREALAALLAQAGFPYVKVEVCNERLIAWAGHKPFADPDMSRFDTARYFEYLEALAQRDDKDARSGALYRLFKELVNLGEYTKAQEVFDRLSIVARDGYGLDIADVPVNAVLATMSFIEHVRRFPAWLGCLTYYAGILYGNHHHDSRRRLTYFDAASRILRHEIKLNEMFAQEAQSLLQTTDFHYRQSLIHRLLEELPERLDDSWEVRLKSELAKLMRSEFPGPPVETVKGPVRKYRLFNRKRAFQASDDGPLT